MSLHVALEALDLLQAKCKEAATFLASRRVPIERIFEEQAKAGIFSGTKVIQQTLGQGWTVQRHGPGIVIAPGGQLWETGLGEIFNGRNLHKSGMFNFQGIRQSLAAGETVRSPLKRFVLEFPQIYGSSPIPTAGTEGVRIRFDHHDSGPGANMESIITTGVVRLVREHS